MCCKCCWLTAQICDVHVDGVVKLCLFQCLLWFKLLTVVFLYVLIVCCTCTVLHIMFVLCVCICLKVCGVCVGYDCLWPVLWVQCCL